MTTRNCCLCSTGSGSPGSGGQRLDWWPPPGLEPRAYKQRNVVERCFNRFKQFRDLATRYARWTAYHQSDPILAAIVLWLR